MKKLRLLRLKCSVLSAALSTGIASAAPGNSPGSSPRNSSADSSAESPGNYPEKSPIERERSETSSKSPPPSRAGEETLDKNALQNSLPSEEASTPKPLQFFYAHNRALSIYGGATYANQVGMFYGLGGVSYMFYSQSRFHYEAAFDALGTLESHFRFMGKWYLKLSQQLRPYYNLGLGVRVMSQDNIAVFLSWPRLFFQGGGGIEWSFSQDFSLRAEAFAEADLSNNSNLAAFGGVTVGF